MLKEIKEKHQQIFWERVTTGATHAEIGEKYKLSSTRIQQICAKQTRLFKMKQEHFDGVKALASAAARHHREAAQHHLQISALLKKTFEVEESSEIPKTPLREVDLSVRTLNCLRNEGFEHLEELEQIAFRELLRIPNFGRRSANELKEQMQIYGLEFAK